jgi:hypothetical protein
MECPAIGVQKYGTLEEVSVDMSQQSAWNGGAEGAQRFEDKARERHQKNQPKSASDEAAEQKTSDLMRKGLNGCLKEHA